MTTYCLFCETDRCRSLGRIAESILPCRAIAPRMIQHQYRKGQIRDVVRDFLPGYLFLYFEEDPGLQVMRMRSIPGTLRFMGDVRDDYRLSGNDESFALRILRCGGAIGKMAVYEEKERFHLVSSEWGELDAAILKVDRRRHRMQVQVVFAKKPVTVWVEYVLQEEKGRDWPEDRFE